MAIPPTPEENARLVLQIYAHFDSRPGHVLRANNFVAVASLRLTENGFAAIPRLERVR